MVLSLKAADTSTTGGTIDLILAILILSYCLGLTIFAYRLLKKKFAKLPEATFRSKFGSLYLNVNTHDRKAVHFTFFFLLRRMLFVGAITLFNFSIVFQVMSLDILSTCLLAFYVSVMPMQGVMNNLMEVMNELSVLASIIYMFVFTDYVPDPVLRYSFGYDFLFFVGGIIALNLLAFIFTIISTIILKVKLWCTRRRRRASIAAAIEEKRRVWRARNAIA